MRIQVLSSLLTMIGFVHGAAVVWPDGYTPTVEERNSAVAEAERREIAAPALGQRSSSDSSLVEPRGLLSKCLQAHCGFESQILLNDVIQFTVWFGDGYIFNLAGGSANIADASTTFTWTVHDNEGRSWRSAQPDGAANSRPCPSMVGSHSTRKAGSIRPTIVPHAVAKVTVTALPVNTPRPFSIGITMIRISAPGKASWGTATTLDHAPSSPEESP
ncbi:hypothetical protein NM208_g16650 [Fusarium decemcellulare]|uniref:Uncharacterized protein n=1 Tax=Fusarium decemcellulare TaxID=57161 RepID=A0ACC1RAZ5_9HYPO|nr:hypothetical protein NM208_g16650 [Fusarium decemcellulare]